MSNPYGGGVSRVTISGGTAFKIGFIGFFGAFCAMLILWIIFAVIALILGLIGVSIFSGFDFNF